MINIKKTYGDDNPGKQSYQLCVNEGRDPKTMAEIMAGVGRIGILTEQITKEFIAEVCPDEVQNFESGKKYILREFAKSAREAGDNETADYVSKLLRDISAEGN